MLAVVDCNNFFASCERIFNPKLINKPIAVLSNNDGCIIARSQEVKDLGVPMGTPVHKWKNFLELNNVVLFSANFELYGDISERIMTILKDFSPSLQIYSIDEAFLDLNSLHCTDYYDYCKTIRKTIVKHTGVYTSIGIGPTKTLTKVANKIAKHHGGVFILKGDDSDNETLEHLKVGDIWGIGWHFAEFLNKEGIYNAIQLKNADDRWIKEKMSVVGQRTVFELRGIPCISIYDVRETKKSIISSRSFGRKITKLNDLQEAVACYVARAAEKLRRQNSVAGMLYVYVRTDKHNVNAEQYSNYAAQSLSTPSSYTPELTEYAFKALDQIYDPRFSYKKALVMLSAIVPEESRQINLFEDNYPFDKYKKIMKAVDHVNWKWGDRSLRVACTGNTQPWKGRRELVSNRATTVWEEIIKV